MFIGTIESILVGGIAIEMGDIWNGAHTISKVKDVLNDALFPFIGCHTTTTIRPSIKLGHWSGIWLTSLLVGEPKNPFRWWIYAFEWPNVNRRGDSECRTKRMIRGIFSTIDAPPVRTARTHLEGRRIFRFHRCVKYSKLYGDQFLKGEEFAFHDRINRSKPIFLGPRFLNPFLFGYW